MGAGETTPAVLMVLPVLPPPPPTKNSSAAKGAIAGPSELSCTIGVPSPPVGAIVSAKVAEPVPLALVALMVTLLVPATVGVPVIAPVAVLTLSPAGSPVAL